MIRLVLPLALLLVVADLTSGATREVPANLDRERLVPWCIVPFDASKRTPAERAEMLQRLGLKRSAYDWRAVHVPEFEEEIRQYEKHGIEFFAFWGGHESAFSLFEKYNLKPQIWRTLKSPKSGSQAEKVKEAADSMEELAMRTARLGSPLGLYNHGGWGSEPENLVAVCLALRERGHAHVGIVYNWHHGHGSIENWAESLELMKPYLLCLNLNGMNSGANPKILTLGQGEHEAAMLDVLIASGYEGPIGILDHQNHIDTEVALKDNLAGLEWLKKEWIEPGSGGPRQKPSGTNLAKVSPAKSLPPAEQTKGPEGSGEALSGGIVINGNPKWRKPPLTVECRARLNSAGKYNILIASDTKASQAHWEVFSMKGSGKLTAYLPGAIPDHVRSDRVITDGQWHEIAMQFHPDRVTLWVDGEEVARQTITLQPIQTVVPGGLAFGRLVEGNLSMDGALDDVRIRRGIFPPFRGSPGEILGEWDFENLASLREDRPGPVFGRKPLEPEANPYWEAEVNRDRVYDFYAKQARAKPDILVEFPGIDGGGYGHWGNQNDQTTWKDGRVRDMDHGSMVSGVFPLPGTKKKIPRVVSISLGNQLNAAFDLDALQVIAAWKGELVTWSDVRRGFMHGIPPGGDPVSFTPLPAPDESAEYLGLYRNGEEVIFSYREKGKVRNRGVRLEEGTIVEFEGSPPSREKLVLQWTERIETRGQLGKGTPYAIDTVTLPFENPYRGLFFASGIDFVSPTRLAICNIHGDVWICDVEEQNLSRLTWKRFAGGLHQPLGLKVVDGVIHVMGRDQITALHDSNGDDEADFYECVARPHRTSTGGHDFITGLERDDQGYWYFASGNEGICRVSPDGKELTQLATGLRNPNGLGISPDGKVVLSSVQEGTWTPASAICEASLGGHFGAGGPREGDRGYVPPMLYLPRGTDNSSGGQTYIDSSRWGPVEGRWIHYSGGFAKHFLVLREAFEGGSQAAAVVLPGSFSSGAHRGRFSPHDGHLYVAGAQGWGNYGVEDGCVQRVRFTGSVDTYPYPIAWETRDNGILLTFSSPRSLGDSDKWFAQQWNYRYGPAYGSAEYSVNHPERKGHDRLEIRSVHSLERGKKWFIEIPQLRPVNQLHLHFDGQPRIELFATIHRLGEPFTNFPGYRMIAKTWGTTNDLVAVDTMDPRVLMSACAACHHPTKQVVGPALSEIRQRYTGNPEGIIKWAMNPENRNPQLPPMPPFDFLGEEKLRIIAEAILSGQ